MSSSDIEEQITSVLTAALEFARRESVDVYTFSFYLDHESSAISVCIDTEENSARQSLIQNEYTSRHIHRAIECGDLDGARLWLANPGRNLSLGDFKYVNVAREDIVSDLSDQELCEMMARALVQIERQVAEASSDPSKLLFSSSLPQDEVGLTWTIGSYC